MTNEEKKKKFIERLTGDAREQIQLEKHTKALKPPNGITKRTIQKACYGIHVSEKSMDWILKAQDEYLELRGKGMQLN